MNFDQIRYFNIYLSFCDIFFLNSLYSDFVKLYVLLQWVHCITAPPIIAAIIPITRKIVPNINASGAPIQPIIGIQSKQPPANHSIAPALKNILDADFDSDAERQKKIKVLMLR